MNDLVELHPVHRILIRDPMRVLENERELGIGNPENKNPIKMKKAKEFLKLSSEESESVSRLTIHPHRVGQESSFYEDFALLGIRVDQVEPGFVSCTFRVPPRLTDRTGRLASGAIANIVDIAGGCVVHVEGLPINVSVDISISFLSTARPDDELEITSRALGQRGGYFGTVVVIRNKTTGEIIAEGRHSLFGKHYSKL